MMSTSRGVHAYRQTEAQSRTPLELVVMLYDGALRFLAQAREAIERHDIPARREALSRTLAIVGELQATLDMERGGDIAVELDRLYGFANARMFEAAQHNDPAAIDDVCRVLTTLRDGWQSIAAGAPEAPR